MANRFQALQSSTASGSLASDGEAAASPSEGGSEHDADMEFARKLQEEEDRIHYERMLQMAGIGTASLLVCHCCPSQRLLYSAKATNGLHTVLLQAYVSMVSTSITCKQTTKHLPACTVSARYFVTEKYHARHSCH